METNEAEGKRRGRRRILGFALVGLGVAGMLVAAMVLRQRTEGRRVRTEIQKRLDALRAAGQPLTAQDLAKLYPDPPPERDASRILKRGLSALVVPNYGEFPLFLGEKLPARSAPLEGSVLAEVQRWLDQNQAALASIPWDELPGSWIGSGFTNGLDNFLEPPSGIISLVRILCLDALAKAEQQNTKGAAESLRRALTVGNTFRNDMPSYFMLRGVSQTTVSATLERVLNRAPFDTSLTDVAAELTITNVGGIRECWVNDERCLGIFEAEALRAQAQQLVRSAHSPVVLLGRVYQAHLCYRDEDLLDYLEWCARCQAALNLPVPEAIPAAAAIDSRKHLPVSHFNSFRKGRSSYLSMKEVELRQFLMVDVRVVSSVRTTIAALAIERWRLAHDGRLPESLAALVPDFLPAVPTDPFDDQPLRYKKLPVGYVVYSVGPDFTDDGGKEKSGDPKDGEHYDITFTVER